MSGNAVFVLIIVLFIGLLMLGSLIGRRWVKESSDFILAGRELSFPINTMGVCLIGFAGTTISLVPSFSMIFGFYGSLTWITAYVVLGLALFGLLFAKFIRRCGAQTLPEYFEMRYGSQARSIISITSIIGMSGILANNILACVHIIVGYTGWNSVIVMAAIFLVVFGFTFISGLWAVSINDFIQVIIGGVALPTMALLLIQRYGGMESISNVWPDWTTAGIEGGILPSFALTYPSAITFAITLSIALVWGNSYYWMRIASCRSETVAKRSFVLSALIMYFVLLLPLVIVGILVGAFHGNVFTFGDAGFPPTNAFGYIASTFSPILGSFFLLGALTASVSTASTAALGSSAVITRDLYQRVINKKADSKQSLRASKVGLVCIAFATFFLCQFPGGPTYLFAFANVWLLPPSILLVLGVVWPRFGRIGALWGSLSGMIVMAAFTILELSNVFSISVYIHLSILGFVVTLLIAIIATLTERLINNYKDSRNHTIGENHHIASDLDSVEIELLSLVHTGHRYMSDLTDILGVDSNISVRIIERLVYNGYIIRKGGWGSAYYTFNITDIGIAALPLLCESHEAMRKEYLTPLYLELLLTLKDHPKEQLWYAQTHSLKSMHMSAISSHLARRGYIIEGGLFKRKLRLTELGAKVVNKYS